MHAIPASLILDNSLTGVKALGADFTPDVAGGATSAPTLVSNPNGYMTCVLAQNVGQWIPGIHDIALAVSRTVIPVKIWLVKTGGPGDNGITPDQVTVFAGPAAASLQISSDMIMAFQTNGTVIESTLITPANMEVTPAAGFILRVNAANVIPTDTRCIVYIECLCSGPV